MQNWKTSLTSRVSASWRICLSRDVSDNPREKAVAEFRLAVGHDCLYDHLQPIGIFESSNCPAFKKEEVMGTVIIC
ncbi:UNVERIFIED_CONTAM: hypothetical protein NCL1_16140 [Trichonephila clavipes]